MKIKEATSNVVVNILSDQKENLAQQKKVLKTVAKGVKKIFLKTDLESIQQADPNAFLILLIETYKHLVFFPDNRIMTKFRKVGLLPRHLHRFVPFKDILKEIRAIGAGGNVIILEHQVFLLIKEYLETKIVNDLVKWAEFTRPYNKRRFVPKTTIFIRDLFRQRKYHGGVPKNCKPGAQESLHLMVNAMNKLTKDEKKTNKMLSLISVGMTERIYLKQVTECCTYQMGSEAFYSRFFPLFSLLVAEKHFKTEQEFYDHSEHYLGRSYKSYQAIIVKKVIQADSSFFGSDGPPEAGEL